MAESCMISGGDRMIPALFDGETVTPQQPLGWYSLMSDLFPDYFPVKQNGRWGLMETQSRRLVIPFRYEAVDVPIGERFPAKEGRWGVVDLMGRTQLPFLYDSVQLNSCVDGKTGCPRLADCSVALRNGKVTLLDRDLHPVWEDLTALPERYGNYLLLRRGRKFGVAAQDGRPISFVSMLKREAMHLIRRLNGKHS